MEEEQNNIEIINNSESEEEEEEEDDVEELKDVVNPNLSSQEGICLQTLLNKND